MPAHSAQLAAAQSKDGTMLKLGYQIFTFDV